MAVEAMKAGAFEFFEKPFRMQDLCDKIQEAVRLDKPVGGGAGSESTPKSGSAL